MPKALHSALTYGAPTSPWRNANIRYRFNLSLSYILVSGVHRKGAHDSRGMFHNAQEYHAMYPGSAWDARTAPARYCAPRVEDGYEIEAVRRRLDLRAGLRRHEPRIGALRGYVDLVSPRGIAGLGTECRLSRSAGVPRHPRRRPADRADAGQPLPRRPRARWPRQRPSQL